MTKYFAVSVCLIALAIAYVYIAYVPPARAEDTNSPFLVAPHVSGTATFWMRTDALTGRCVSEVPTAQQECLSFIAGVDDAFVLVGTEERPLHCAAPNLSPEVYRKAYLLYVGMHPELMENPAANTVAQALNAIFSCKRLPPLPKRPGL